MSTAELNTSLQNTLSERDSLLRREETALAGKIMIVDDELILIKAVQKHLRGAGYSDFVYTEDSRTAVNLIRRERPDLLVLDIMMPHVTGINILEVIRGDLDLAHLPVLIVTAATDDKTRAEALELGATDWLNKPIKPAELIPRVKNALLLKAHHDQMAAYSKRLENEVAQRTAELVRSNERLIHVLACAAEYRDRETGNHVLRVAKFAAIIADELGFSGVRVEMIEQAATLHDVGKLGIPDSILLKPGRFDEEEFATMQRHCEYGRNILRGLFSHDSLPTNDRLDRAFVDSPLLVLASTISMSHHEKWDGSGYPRGLSGENIPIEGRITAVADVFDALSSHRPYKDPLPLDRCFEILEEGRGKHFDPMVLDAFLARSEEVVKVALELADE